MTLHINPPIPATQVYPWLIVQEFYLSILKAKSDFLNGIDPTLSFEVIKNRYQNYIEGSFDKIVNILISEIEDTQESIHGKEKIITFAFQFFASAEIVSNIPADEMVIEKAMYLSAVIEETITALYNINDPVLPFGSMVRGSMTHKFSIPSDINSSDRLYFGGVMEMRVRFFYSFLDTTYQDLLNIQINLFDMENNFTINRS